MKFSATSLKRFTCGCLVATIIGCSGFVRLERCHDPERCELPEHIEVVQGIGASSASSITTSSGFGYQANMSGITTAGPGDHII